MTIDKSAKIEVVEGTADYEDITETAVIAFEEKGKVRKDVAAKNEKQLKKLTQLVEKGINNEDLI